MIAKGHPISRKWLFPIHGKGLLQNQKVLQIEFMMSFVPLHRSLLRRSGFVFSSDKKRALRDRRRSCSGTSGQGRFTMSLVPLHRSLLRRWVAPVARLGATGVASPQEVTNLADRSLDEDVPSRWVEWLQVPLALPRNACRFFTSGSSTQPWMLSAISASSRLNRAVASSIDLMASARTRCYASCSNFC